MSHKLYNDNCLSVLPTVADGSVDLTVTSPPYDNLRDYGKEFDPAAFDWKAIIRELYRVTAVGGVVVWVVGDASINGSESLTSFRQAIYAQEVGFLQNDTMIFHRQSAPHPNRYRYEQHFEYMFVWSKDRPRTLNKLRDVKNKYAGSKITSTSRLCNGRVQKHSGVLLGKCLNEYGERGNIWKYAVGTPKMGDDDLCGEHPARFPEKLAHDHIISWSNENDVILDPMMGSGTTIAAAIRAGRHNVIGIELDAGYFAITQKRVDRAWRDYNNRVGNYQLKENEILTGQKPLFKEWE